MPLYSAAYSSLLNRLSEIDLLVVEAKRHQRIGVSRADRIVNTFCRSSVVLLSSHLEGYAEELASIAIDKIVRKRISKKAFPLTFSYYLSRDLIDALRESSDPEVQGSKIMEIYVRDNHIWGVEENFEHALDVDAFKKGFSNPTAEKIYKFFGRFGYRTLKRDLQRRMKADFAAAENMINQIVDLRNKIAHGDAVISSTPIDVLQMLDLSKKFCRNADRAVCDWFKKLGCSIR